MLTDSQAVFFADGYKKKAINQVTFVYHSFSNCSTPICNPTGQNKPKPNLSEITISKLCSKVSLF